MGSFLKETPKKVEARGEVLDTDQRKVTRTGCSTGITIPKKANDPGWKRFLTAPILEISLVKDVDGETFVMITRPKKVGP